LAPSWGETSGNDNHPEAFFLEGGDQWVISLISLNENLYFTFPAAQKDLQEG